MVSRRLFTRWLGGLHVDDHGPEPLLKSLAKPNFMIKIIPLVDCTPRVCELVRYYCEDVTLKGARSGSAAIELLEHAFVRR